MSEPRPNEYFLVIAAAPLSLAELVQSYLAAGWHLQGGVAVWHVSEDDHNRDGTYFAQAMCRRRAP